VEKEKGKINKTIKIYTIMKTTDIIKKRKSIRSYNGIALDSKCKQDITDYISSLPQPFGSKARIVLLSLDDNDNSVKLRTYGVVSGAHDYLVLAYEEGTLAAVNAGYLFEQVILFCTGKGIGSYWVGGTFRKSDFSAQAKIKENEIMPAISPLGYAADKAKFRDSIMKMVPGSNKRKPFEQLFFDTTFDQPLEKGGLYDMPLEMVRLAPSSLNGQPWRILVSDSDVHFYYKKKSDWSEIDMGIALCHFEQTCKELGINGSYAVMEDKTPIGDLKYLISWKSAL